ncbi:hypothetical protein NMG60_11017757 [Bertholletia excelsa]
MSPLTAHDLHQIFEKLDQNGDGFVSLDELNRFLERIGVETTLDELKLLVGKTKLDVLDFFIFYDTVIEENKNEEGNEVVESELEKAFKVYDLNGDGFISGDELRTVLSRLGLWNEGYGRDCKRMISVYDTNSDGLLDFEEFKKMMLFGQ